MLDQSCHLSRDVNSQDPIEPKYKIAWGYAAGAVFDEKSGFVKTSGKVDLYCVKAQLHFVFRALYDVI